MPDFPKSNRFRQRIRLEGFNYANEGAYFITIVTSRRKCLFGNILNEEMILSKFGEIAQVNWNEIPNHFSYVRLDSFCIMPNHIHALLIIDPHEFSESPKANSRNGLKGSLSAIIGSYKSKVTKEIRKLNYQNDVWQISFYEHIVRNTDEYDQFSRYILDNPMKWSIDPENQESF